MQYRLWTVDVFRKKTRRDHGVCTAATMSHDELKQLVGNAEFWYLSNDTAKRRFEASMVKSDAAGLYHMENGNEYTVRVYPNATQLDEGVEYAARDRRDAESSQQVDPWTVSAGAGESIDYGKLTQTFGCDLLNEALWRRMEQLTGKRAHRWLRRGYFYSHRELDHLMNLYEAGKSFYLYTGRGPSSESLHVGHMIPFLFTKWLQDAFDVPLVIQMTGDEKFLWKRNLRDLDHVRRLTRENIKDIIAVGFDVRKTFVCDNLRYVGGMYDNIVNIQRLVTANTVKGTFGFTGSHNIGQYAFPAIQAAPSFSTSFPHIFDPEQPPVPCLIPCAIDQDPYFRMTREVAPKLGLLKPALIHSKFFPALQGASSKMSSSDENSAIFLTDTRKQIHRKIHRFAFSGGKDTAEEQREFGADLEVDVAYQYLQFFLEDDQELARIADDYSSGRLLTGEVKNILVDVLAELVGRHQTARALVSDSLVETFCAVRNMRQQ